MDLSRNEAVIVAYGRTPVCRARKGAFAAINPIEYGYQALLGTLAKIPQLKPEEIEDVIVGCALPGNELGWNVARMLIHRAGLPDSIPGQVVNRYCSSGLQSIAACANAITAGQSDVMVAGGIEYMSSKAPMNEMQYANAWILQNYPGAYVLMGETAENVAKQMHVTRLEMEEMAVESHAKAYAAQQSGYLNQAIIPVKVILADGTEKWVTQDEGIRPGTSMETLAGLQPCFKENGRVTAATSSQMSDGASFVVLMNRRKADALKIKPIARLTAFAVAGCHGEVMGLGPIYAVPKVLKKSGLTVGDMDVIELNEAFASQAIACIKELQLPRKKVNPWGGAMALGHPMGATGGFLTSKALDYLRLHHRRYGMVTMCIGGGQGAAAIFERL